MTYLIDQARLVLARRFVAVAEALTDTVESRHRANVTRAMVRNAMLLSGPGAFTKVKDC